MTDFVPFIVGLGGTTRSGSTSEVALRFALRAAERAGATTSMLAGPALQLPMYAPEKAERSEGASELVSLLRRSHGVILASPGYHGSISGLVKNALDYVEDMRGDTAVYFDGRAVGCVACAQGWQATGSTLAALRSVVHALRGWPTPVGVAVNSSLNLFDAAGHCLDTGIGTQLEMMAQQVVAFAHMRAAACTGIIPSLSAVGAARANAYLS
jgi:FMN reductase